MMPEVNNQGRAGGAMPAASETLTRTPSTVRTIRRAAVRDRHAIPDPKTGVAQAREWANTLANTRVPDLFKTKEGLVGHMQQLQCELNRARDLRGLEDEHKETIIESQKMLKKGVEKAKQAAKKAGMELDGSLKLTFDALKDAIKV